MSPDLFIPLPGQRATLPTPADDLQERAARLWPDSAPLRDKWISAVRSLRDGRGWILDPGTPAPGWCARPLPPAAYRS